jgi:hypothetical protein
MYWPYSNVQAFDDFRRSLGRYFKIQRFFPTSHNWHHLELSRMLAVEYFFICSPRYAPETEDR